MHRCAHCNQPLIGAAEVFAAHITGQELALMKIMVSGEIVTVKAMMVHLYGRNYQVDDARNSLAQVIRRANQRIKSAGFKLVNVYGVGYQLMRYSMAVGRLTA